MNCHACSRRTLALFFREITHAEGARHARHAPFPRFFSTAHRLQSNQAFADNAKPFGTHKPESAKKVDKVEKECPSWLLEKEATKRKLNGEAWNPRKKLSPDTMEGIRYLHKTQPERFTTPVLAQHFKVSPEAIKRILRSKWRPTDEEQEDRLKRWDKRGEQIWSNLVELGVKPPKKWREMGVGRATNGEKPKWKSRFRNQVTVEDSFAENPFAVEEDDIIPIVDGKSTSRPSRRTNVPVTDRIGA